MPSPYRNVLLTCTIQAPTVANLRIQAKEAIRDRQVLLMSLRSKGCLNACNKTKLKLVLNKLLAKINKKSDPQQSS